MLKALGFGETLFKENVMNKKHSLYFGVAVLLLAAIVTLAGCGNNNGSPSIETFTSSDAAGTTYILVITDGSYELTIKQPNGPERKSTGEAVMNANGSYTLKPVGNPNAGFTVTTSGNGISGITGAITPDGGGTINPPTTPLSPAKTITVTGLAPYASYGVKGNAAFLLYTSSYYSPTTAGYGNISGDKAEVALKSVPQNSNFSDLGNDPRVTDVVNLIKEFPYAWTGNGSYYIMLFAGNWILQSKSSTFFSDAPNITIEFELDDFIILRGED
jgi:hypothetical protein